MDRVGDFDRLAQFWDITGTAVALPTSDNRRWLFHEKVAAAVDCPSADVTNVPTGVESV